MSELPDLPPARRARPKPDPEDERVVPRLAAAPLDLPPATPPDPFAGRRAKAEHLCLWLACARRICRRTRHCRGRLASCVFENRDVTRPLLE